MRFLLPGLVALMINAALFAFMQQMTTGQTLNLNASLNAEIIDFIRTPDAFENQTQSQRKPPPEPPKNPETLPSSTSLQPIAKSKPQPLPMPVSALKLENLSSTLDANSPSLGPMLTEQASTEGLEYSGGLEFVMGQDMQTLFNPLPRYPHALKRRKIEGYVIVDFTVTTQGQVENPVIMESSPKGAFDKSVLRTIKRWKFHPRERDGKIVAVRVRQRVVFSLSQ